MSKTSKKRVFPDDTTTVSACECTGMMPRLPEDDAEYEAYQDMFGMEIPEE